MYFRLSSLFALSILLSFAAIGQGLIRGAATDSSTGERLIGVNVLLVGTSLGNATDIEGSFRITAVPAGSYVLRASYLGYRSQEMPVMVVEGQELILNVVLAPSVIEGDEVIITGQARGQVAAINQQITATSIINVVSEERIKELPDANAAEAIGRLPGVSIIRSGGEATQVVLRGLSSRFSNITIDGAKIPPTDFNSRDVDLSTISQGSLAGVELVKALTPDMDADAIAGSVNLVTKNAPTERVLRLTSRGGYNQLMNSAKQYDVQVQYGERFFDGFLGLQLTGNAENRIRSNETEDRDYLTRDTNSDSHLDEYEINDFRLRFVDETRTRKGAGVILDAVLPVIGPLKFNNVYSETRRDYLIAQRNYPLIEDIVYSAEHTQQDISTVNSSLHGSSSFVGFGVSWGASLARSRSEIPFDFYLDFLEPSSDSAGVRSEPPTLKDHPELLLPYYWNNFAAATCSTGYDRAQTGEDEEHTLTIDLERTYTVADIVSGTLKFGGKFRSKTRSMVVEQLYAPYYLGYWKATNLDGSPKQLTGTRFARFYSSFMSTGFRLPLATDFIDYTSGYSRDLFGTYTIAPLIRRDALDLWRSLNVSGWDPSGGSLASEYYVDPLVEVNNYDVTERVSAAYVMHTLNFGREVTLLTGVRVEAERNDYGSRFLPQEASGFPITGVTNDTSASFSETIWLPNVLLTVRPTEYLSIRAAAYRALARPDFNLRMMRYAAQRSGATSTLSVGNPGLRTAKAWNYEVNTSVHSPTIGLVSVSVFYKVIDDFAHQLNGLTVIGDSLYRSFGIQWPAPSFASSAYLLTAPYNSPRPTKIWGLEVEHQTNFTAHSGFLRHLVLSYNFSLSRSETFLFSSQINKDSSRVVTPRNDTLWTYLFSTQTLESKQRLESQPEFFANASIGYDYEEFSVRLSYFYQGEYTRVFSALGESDQVVDSFSRWDLAMKYDVTHWLSVVCSINNLTNVAEQTSIVNRFQAWQIPNTHFSYGRTGDLGVRITM